MQKSTKLTIAASALVVASLPAEASPLPVTNWQVATTSNDGCPPGTYRDPKGVAAAKEAYSKDANAQAKAIAGVPCVGSTSFDTTGGDPSAAMPPAAKAAIQAREGLAPVSEQPRPTKPH